GIEQPNVSCSLQRIHDLLCPTTNRLRHQPSSSGNKSVLTQGALNLPTLKMRSMSSGVKH
ncbi:MAG: hypothetical protein ACI9HA_003577, partial [Dinoroseobacter sp.]